MSEFTDQVHERWTLNPEEEELLQVADQARSRWLQIRTELDALGRSVMIPGRYENSPRLSPLVGAEARARESYIKALRACHLNEA